MTSPALAFASVSSVFKEQSTLSADTAVLGTLFARWRTGGAVLLCPVPAAYRLPCGASCYATGLPRVFQPCFGKFFFEAVIGLSEAAGGTLAACTHTTTRAVTKVA